MNWPGKNSKTHTSLKEKTQVVQWRLHRSPLKFLTNPYFLWSWKPIFHLSYIWLWTLPRCGQGKSAWPSQALPGQPNFSQIRQSHLVCVIPPFIRHEAHERTPMTCALPRGKRYRWGWPWMCLPARTARERHLTSCSVNTPLPHGPKGHVLGCGAEEKFSLPIRQGLCLSGPL